MICRIVYPRYYIIVYQPIKKGRTPSCEPIGNVGRSLRCKMRSVFWGRMYQTIYSTFLFFRTLRSFSLASLAFTREMSVGTWLVP